MNNGALSKNKRVIAERAQKDAKLSKSSTMTKAKTLLGSIKKSKYEDAMNEEGSAKRLNVIKSGLRQLNVGKFR